MKKLLMFAILPVIALVGCKEFETQDGRIPNEYVAQAQTVAGNYSGKFDKTTGTLHLNIVDANKPQASFTAANGSSDVFGGRCGAVIGDLQKVTFKENNGEQELTGATFAFNPNRCAIDIEGRSLNLNFKRKSSGRIEVKASILAYEEWRRENCSPRDPSCGFESTSVYFYGKFSK